VQVQDVMTRDVCVVSPDTALDVVARLFAAHRICGAPVVVDGTPIGVVTLADLVTGRRRKCGGYPSYYRTGGDVVTDAEPPPAGKVADVMSPFVLAIEATADLASAAARMLADDVHRLLVMDRARIIGIVTSMDLLRGFAREAA
jgi:predicted transcriptional regulator